MCEYFSEKKSSFPLDIHKARGKRNSFIFSIFREQRVDANICSDAVK